MFHRKREGRVRGGGKPANSFCFSFGSISVLSLSPRKCVSKIIKNNNTFYYKCIYIKYEHHEMNKKTPRKGITTTKHFYQSQLVVVVVILVVRARTRTHTHLHGFTTNRNYARSFFSRLPPPNEWKQEQTSDTEEGTDEWEREEHFFFAAAAACAARIPKLINEWIKKRR